MVKEKIKFGLGIYDYYKENNIDILEKTNEKGFKIQYIFDMCDKSKKQLDDELINLIFKKR
jgi:hypothetical protein